MVRYILTRLLYMVPVLWLVVSVVFLLIHLVPGDPIQQTLGEGASAADIEVTRHAYGLDVPVGRQYINYWKGILHGDLGRSLRFDQPVTRLILQRYPETMRLTLASMLVALLISIPPGYVLDADVTAGMIAPSASSASWDFLSPTLPLDRY